MKVGSYEDFSDASLLNLHVDNIEESDKWNIFKDIKFKAIVPSIINHFFYQRMVDFLNKLEFNDQEYQTNGNARDENFKENLLFPMKDFV